MAKAPILLTFSRGLNEPEVKIEVQSNDGLQQSPLTLFVFEVDRMALYEAAGNLVGKSQIKLSAKLCN